MLGKQIYQSADVYSKEVVLTKFVSEVALTLRLQAIEKGLVFHIAYLEPLPKSIWVDSQMLQKILHIMISNAIQYTQSGSILIEVSLTAATNHADKKLAWTVKDTGCGIEFEHIPMLFQTGIKLAEAKAFAHKLGGNIELVASELGIGSTFSVTIDPGYLALSFLDFAANTLRDSIRGRLYNYDTPHLEGLSVLLVDDSCDIQQFLQCMLLSAGAKVSTASNGLEAVDCVRGDSSYDIVLMDIQMPIMDGFKATRELRKSGFAKPIIAVTAHSLLLESKMWSEIGFDDYLSKPVDINTLLHKIYQLTRYEILSKSGLQT